LNPEALSEFFAGGEEYLRWIWELIAAHFGAGFRPVQAMDFGCGVGRLVIPMASRCEKAIGVDVSPSMIAEAKKNCKEKNIHNVEFVLGFDALDPSLKFDFINSFIVFQHMRKTQGMEVFRKMLSLLNPGGIGALHFNYRAEVSFKSTCVGVLRRRSQWANGFFNILRGSPWGAPWMQMNPYDLNALAAVLTMAGCP
jgi:SAM-dependent methyltransferase